jgi:hypothetical protein
LIVGPFRLGDAFQQMSETDREIGSAEAITKGGGPNKEDIVRALNDCKVYVIQARKKAASKPDKWDFADLKGTPKAVVEGKLSFRLKDRKGKDFNIHVRELNVLSLDYRDAAADTPELCRVYIAIKLGTSPYLARGVGIVEWHPEDLNFNFGPVFWDAKGKVWQVGPKKE